MVTLEESSQALQERKGRDLARSENPPREGKGNICIAIALQK